MTGEGLPELLALIAAKLSDAMEEVEVLLPHTRGDLVQQIHASGQRDIFITHSYDYSCTPCSSVLLTLHFLNAEKDR